MIVVVVAIVHAAGALAPVVGGCGRLGCSLPFGALSYTAPEARGGALAPSPLLPSLTRPGDRRGLPLGQRGLWLGLAHLAGGVLAIRAISTRLLPVCSLLH